MQVQAGAVTYLQHKVSNRHWYTAEACDQDLALAMSSTSGCQAEQGGRHVLHITGGPRNNLVARAVGVMGIHLLPHPCSADQYARTGIPGFN
jgi:hypothetical protein